MSRLVQCRSGQRTQPLVTVSCGMPTGLILPPSLVTARRDCYLAGNNLPVNVVPIFSSEPDFMGSGLIQSHAQIEAYNKYLTDYNADNSAWKAHINLQGYQWFCYGYMPKPVPRYRWCHHDLQSDHYRQWYQLLHRWRRGFIASTGDSYLWSNGATTPSISVSTAGTYTCRVTKAGVSATTPAVTVTVFNAPSVVMTVGALLGQCTADRERGLREAERSAATSGCSMEARSGTRSARL